MKALIKTLAFATVLLIVGCGEKEESFTRYPSVAVPGYTTEDYLRDLSDPNPELVYNAVCNLAQRASQFSRTLCAKDADPASPQYQEAEEAYRAVCAQLDSDIPLTVAVSLRFLQLFAKDYNHTDELLKAATSVKSKHTQVQYEQTVLLNRLVNDDSELPETLLSGLLNSPSWIVSRTAYQLVGKRSGEPARQELVQRYLESENEREQLLIIDSLRQNLLLEEARMLETEMLSTTNVRIRHATSIALAHNTDVDGVAQWMIDQYTRFTDAERKEIFEETDDIRLGCRFIEMGYVPDENILNCMLSSLLDEEESDDRLELEQLDRALATSPHTAERWQTLKNEAEQKRKNLQMLNEGLEPITTELRENVLAFQATHGLEDSEMEGVWKIISETMKPPKKEK